MPEAANTAAAEEYRLRVDVNVPEVRGAITRVERLVFANRTVYDTHANSTLPQRVAGVLIHQLHSGVEE